MLYRELIFLKKDVKKYILAFFMLGVVIGYFIYKGMDSSILLFFSISMPGIVIALQATQSSVMYEKNNCIIGCIGVSFIAVCTVAADGDPTCLEPFHKPQMHLFSGQLTVLVQSGKTPGDIIVEVSAKGVRKSTITIKAE